MNASCLVVCGAESRRTSSRGLGARLLAGWPATGHAEAVDSQSARRRLCVGAATLVCVASMAGCSDHSEAFQTACDHLATANYALEDGDRTTANDELERAYSWIVPAYEDVTSSERDALETFSAAVGAARGSLGAEAGQQAIRDAEKACR